MGNVSCLNCGESTANHAVCDKCFTAAEKGKMAERCYYRPSRGMRARLRVVKKESPDAD